MRPFHVQLGLEPETGDLGKIDMFPLDVSDLSAGESVDSSRALGRTRAKKQASARCRHQIPSKKRNERISRKERNERKRQSKRHPSTKEMQGNTKTCSEAMRKLPVARHAFRRSQTLDIPTSIRREQSSCSSQAPTLPLRKSSTGPVQPRRPSRNHHRVVQRHAIHCCRMGHTFQSVFATTEHGSCGHCHGDNFQPGQIMVGCASAPRGWAKEPTQAHFPAQGDMPMIEPPFGDTFTTTTTRTTTRTTFRHHRDDPRRPYYYSNPTPLEIMGGPATNRENRPPFSPSLEPAYRRTFSLDEGYYHPPSERQMTINWNETRSWNDDHHCRHTRRHRRRRNHMDQAAAYRRTRTMDSLPSKPRRRDSLTELHGTYYLYCSPKEQHRWHSFC